MRTNPYTALLDVMQEAGGAGAPQGTLRSMLGTVLAADPLTVDVGGTTQEAGRFYIASRLLEGYQETYTPSGALAIRASCAYGAHGSMTVSGGTLTLTNPELVLKAGDLVLLLTEDGQTFYLIDKVVHL